MANERVHKGNRKKKHHKDIRYDDDIHVTYHGVKRVRERLGLPKNAVMRNLDKALKYGVPREYIHGPLRRYIDALYYQYETANNLRVYNRHVYVICGDVLVTVLNVPYKYFDAADAAQRRIKIELEGKNGKP